MLPTFQSSGPEFELLKKTTLLNIFFFSLGILLFVFYAWYYTVHPPMIFRELVGQEQSGNKCLRGTFVVMVEDRPGLLHGISRIWDLTVTEENQYRPRTINFLLLFLEYNFVDFINRNIPWGFRLPLYYMACLALSHSLYLLLSLFFAPYRTYGKGFFLWLAVTGTFSFAFQVGLSYALRSAKLLAIPFCLYVLYFFLQDCYYRLESSGRKTSFLFLMLFVFCLTDEQITAVILLCFLLSWLESLNRRKICGFSVASSMALALYWIYIQYPALSLHQHFTPTPLKVQDHDLVQRLTQFQFDHLSTSLTVFLHCIRVFFTNPFVWLLLIVVAIHFLFRAGTRRDIFLFLSLLCGAFALLTGILIAHPLLFELKECWDTPYMLPQMMLLFTAFLFAFSRSLEVLSLRWKARVIFLCATISLFVAWSHWSNCEKAYSRLLESAPTRNAFFIQGASGNTSGLEEIKSDNQCEEEFFRHLKQWKYPIILQRPNGQEKRE